ncbi:hypothetical protein DSM106972_007160 [Dulcicalothrix desertica PCC 7102]|uniref:Filamentous haemagglutinin FhaB/tRNA nuclease CdiA-like TPS domain-containing protein n=1 Tax=Dulcicalothrix desertica PCC 7102 TaxID=232991 RepID=A0A433VVU7_9CYAN|nr:S-layer family protein [Dulcicalothrix desertica]RUT10221.1 hypothetical protein DSM106972_007160 [Dulcicalothrix desertica PCC 7102]TWH40801.1 filamentous hemagglutinin family protein [Dulcicalothrix desertica PCC 7102]
MTTVRSYGAQLAQACYLIIGAIAAIFTFDVVSCGAFAQITPDGTLPNNSHVSVQGKTRVIEQGTKVGENLFHSFEKFSVPTGIIADFNNPLDIQNIITRVTGNEVSNINGSISAKGAANLFLLNPNGIIFGRNASLNIGGSFIGSTASSINFADGTRYSVSKESTPLLTVSVPIGLQFGTNPGSISNQSQVTDTEKQRVGLQVKPEKTLALVSGDITLNGGYLTATGGNSTGGRIELGSVASNSLVSLKPVSKGWALGYENTKNFGDIKLSRQAIVNASGNGGGDIHIEARSLRLTEGARVLARTLNTRHGGKLTINASESVEIIGVSANGKEPSGLRTETRGDGDAGALTVNTKRLLLQDGGLISTGAILRPPIKGAGGNININASESVELIGETIGKTPDDTFQSRLTTQTRGDGAAGDLTINTGKLSVKNGGQIAAGTFPRSRGAGGNLIINASDSVEVLGISADNRVTTQVSRITNLTAGAGNAKTLTIDTKKLTAKGGGLISAGAISRSSDPNNLSFGQGGTLNINASDSVEVIGGIPRSNIRSRLTTSTEGAGNAGNLTINTGKLIIKEGGQVSAGTNFYSIGEGGNLTINASESVEVSGESLYGEQVYSRLTNRTSGQGNVATSKINTKKLIIQDGGQVSSDTLNQGLAGKLDVTASDSIEIRGTSSDNFPSRLSALTGNNSASSAGDLSINTGQLIIENGADVTVGATGLGDAGNLLIEADNITLNNQGSIKASTVSGEGGNINLQVLSLILMRHNSSISTQAGNNGNGGNIDISSQFIVANKRENNDIIANAERGSGGKINITTQGIYGLEYRPQLTNFSDINASSQFGINGTVLINTQDLDPNRGLINLPVEPGTPQVAQDCQVGSENQSQFVVTGRGGLPSNPRVAFSSDTPQVDWVTRARSNNQYKSPVATQNSTTPTQPIVEATSLVKNANGEVFLREAPIKSREEWQRMTLGCNG